MASKIYSTPRVREFTSSGTVLNGGKLYFYLAGTTTPATVYTSSAMTTPHAHPVLATTAGLFPAIWLAAGVSYDVTCKNSAGAVQWTALNYSEALTADEVGPALTAAWIGAALYPRTDAETTAGVTPTDYSYPPGDVRRYGAVGSGDETTEIQAAFDSNNKVIFDPSASYTIGHIDITQNFEVFAGNAQFTLSGHTAGFFANGTITYGRWHGGRITGDGVNRDADTANCQVGISIGNDAGANVSNVIIYDPVIDQANIGIRVAYGTSPNDPVDHAVIVNPRITGSVGYVGGAGYGILMSQVPGGRVQGGCISGCQRHGMYFSEGERYIASDVEVYGCGKGDGTIRGPVCVSRSGLVTLTNLNVHDNADVGMTIDVDSAGIAPKTLTEVNIVGGVWKDNDYGDITIGTLESPATGGLPHNVKITGAQLTMPASPGGASIVVHHCDRLDIHDVTIDATAVTAGSARLITFDAVGGATYTDRISVKRNTFRGGGGGTIYGIQVPAALATGSTEIDLRDNDFDSIDSEYEILGGSVTNNNLLYPRTAVVASAAALTLPLGFESFSITGTTSITSIVATGFDGKTVRLIFDGILTVTDGSNLKLSGNFVTSADDVMTLVCNGANWHEVSRSAN